MFCINLESDDPYFNLALEEHLLKKSLGEFLIIGVNKPSVIIGKHQTAPREVNMKFISGYQIPVIRRISGGGTVFHDEGNVNFTFIRNTEEGKQIDFRKHTKTAIDFLCSLGIDARFEGKNDIRLNGLKISGNAEHVHRNRVLHHGTMLFSTSLDMLRNSIRQDTSCYTSRGVESVRSSVVNLKDYLKKFSNISDFRSEMMKYFMDDIPGSVKYNLTRYDIEEAQLLAESRYRTWEWNWAYGPEYQFTNSFLFENEQILFQISVKEGIITECEIKGPAKLSAAAEKLIGCRHMADDMITIFRNENISVIYDEIFNFF
jgi:lipoate---protein ligase